MEAKKVKRTIGSAAIALTPNRLSAKFLSSGLYIESVPSAGMGAAITAFTNTSIQAGERNDGFRYVCLSSIRLSVRFHSSYHNEPLTS